MIEDKVNEMIKARITWTKAEVSERHRLNFFYSGPKYEMFNEDKNE